MKTKCTSIINRVAQRPGHSAGVGVREWGENSQVAAGSQSIRQSSDLSNQMYTQTNTLTRQRFPLRNCLRFANLLGPQASPVRIARRRSLRRHPLFKHWRLPTPLPGGFWLVFPVTLADSRAPAERRNFAETSDKPFDAAWLITVFARVPVSFGWPSASCSSNCSMVALQVVTLLRPTLDFFFSLNRLQPENLRDICCQLCWSLNSLARDCSRGLPWREWQNFTTKMNKFVILLLGLLLFELGSTFAHLWWTNTHHHPPIPHPCWFEKQEKIGWILTKVTL